MTPLLELKDLSRIYPLSEGGKVHALEHVSLNLNRGETLAIVGESGCGISTMANLACRLDTPSGGQVILDGHDITQLGPRALRPHRRKMQMIFQDPFASLDPRRTVGFAVGEPLIVNGLMKKGPELDKAVGQLFERVGLTREQVSNFPHQFSGGQRQRICIARALALKPELVIADESVSALDVSVQAQVINLMMELQAEMGLSYLFIAHDLAVVERMAHRVAVMYLGQMVELGTRRAIFENPQHSYTKRLLAAAPIADPRQRRERELLVGDIPSPVWADGEAPPRVQLAEVSEGHWAAVE